MDDQSKSFMTLDKSTVTGLHVITCRFADILLFFFFVVPFDRDRRKLLGDEAHLVDRADPTGPGSTRYTTQTTELAAESLCCPSNIYRFTSECIFVPFFRCRAITLALIH